MDRPIPKKFVALDFETFFSKSYSLRSKAYTTTTYVRSPEFKAQCVGLQSNRAKAARWYPTARITKTLAAIDWSTTGVLCHNTQFDGFILSQHYNIFPAFYFCTLSMARAIHGGDIKNGLDALAKYYGGRGKIEDYLMPTQGIRDLPRELMVPLGNGCARDVEETMRLFNIMREGYPDVELQLIDETVRMYVDPILVINKDLAREELEREAARRRAAVDVARPIVRQAKLGIDVNNEEALQKALRNREIFATLLRANGCEPPLKESKTTGKETYAFAQADLEFQELSEHPNKKIRALVEAKAVVSSTIGESKPARMIEHADPRFPVLLNYGKAKTIRWTGGDKINLQAIARGTKLRNAIEAPPGYTLVIGDSSQIEDRTNCEVAGQEDVLEAYRAYDAGKGPDVYKLMAAGVYHLPPEKVSGGQRFVGKVARLQLGYQSGLPKFDYTLKAGLMGPPVELPPNELHTAFWTYRTKNNMIVEQWARAQRLLPVMANGDNNTAIELGPLVFMKQRIRLPNGMFIRYPRLRGEYNPERGRWDNFVYNENTNLYGGKVVENFVQALARIIVAEQLLAALHEMREARLVLLVHDEGVYCVKKSYAKTAARIVAKWLKVPPWWLPNIPLNGEVTISPFYIKG